MQNIANPADNTKDSNAGANGMTECFDLPDGGTNLTIDAGFKPLAPPCSVNSAVTNITCLDNGTVSPADDLFTFDLTVTGANTGSGWSAVINGQTVTGTYNTPKTLGPYAIAGGTLSFDIVDNQTANCKVNQSVVPPPSCSVTPPATLGDFVWNDLDKDGIQDPNEPGISGVTVQLKDCNNNVLQTIQTNANGLYLFENLTPGCYRIGVVKPAGFDFSPANQTNDQQDSDIDPNTSMTADVVLAPGDVNRTVDAGLTEIPLPPGSIGDFVWNDTDKDGIQDANEPGVNGVTVQLLDCNNQVIATTTTNGVGFYTFTGLNAGCYKVRVLLPDGYQFTQPNQGSDGTKNSDVNPSNGMTNNINLAQGENNPNIDAGIFKPDTTGPGKIGDFVWFDANGNGMQDAGEPGIPGVIVILQKCNGAMVAFTTTDPNGMYMFNNVQAGDYQVKFANPGNYNGVPIQPTIQFAGSDPSKDSNADWLGVSACFTLNPGETNLTIDAGFKGDSPVICDNITDGGQIGYDESECQTYNPAEIVNLQLPSGGTGQIEYVWLKSTTGCPDNPNQAIPNSNSPTYDPEPINQTTWFLRCARRAGCDVYIESNCIKKEVKNCGSPSCNVSVKASPGKLSIEGLNAPNVAVQVFNADYSNKVFDCFNNCGNPVVLNLAPGTYHVKVNLWAANWTPICEVNESPKVPSQFTGGGTGNLGAPSGNGNTGINPDADAAQNLTGLEVYPNPASHSAVVRWSSEANWQSATLTVFNQLGQQVQMVKIGDAAAGSIDLDLNEMNDGQYFLHFRADGQNPVVKKLTVKR